MSDDLPEGYEHLVRFQRGSPFSAYDPSTGDGLERGAPTEAELRDAYAAPGRPADHRYGVVYHADFETLDDGLCRHARVHAAALSATGLPVTLRSIGHRVRMGDGAFVAGEDLLDPTVFEQVKPLLRRTIAEPLVVVHQAVVRSAARLRALVLPLYARASPQAASGTMATAIVYTPWERTTVDPDLARALSGVGQLWLQCRRNAEVFVAAGVPREKIRLVPNAYDPRGPVATIPQRRPRPGSQRLFYSIGKWEPRKNHHGLLGAFLTAFRPRDDAHLLLKTTPFGQFEGYPGNAEESLADWLEHGDVRRNGWTKDNLDDRIRIERRLLREDQIARIHELGNVYVSASHAEAWDYPAFDARSAGNRLVYVGMGGPEDYARPDDVAVTWTFGNAHPGYGWEKDARWAVYAREDLARALAEAQPIADRRVGAEGLGAYTTDAVGRAMARYAIELVETWTHEGARILRDSMAEARTEAP